MPVCFKQVRLLNYVLNYVLLFILLITRFWDGSACALKRTWSEYCRTNDFCNDFSGLTCINNTCK